MLLWRPRASYASTSAAVMLPRGQRTALACHPCSTAPAGAAIPLAPSPQACPCSTGVHPFAWPQGRSGRRIGGWVGDVRIKRGVSGGTRKCRSGCNSGLPAATNGAGACARTQASEGGARAGPAAAREAASAPGLATGSSPLLLPPGSMQEHVQARGASRGTGRSQAAGG